MDTESGKASTLAVPLPLPPPQASDAAEEPPCKKPKSVDEMAESLAAILGKTGASKVGGPTVTQTCPRTVWVHTSVVRFEPRVAFIATGVSEMVWSFSSPICIGDPILVARRLFTSTFLGMDISEFRLFAQHLARPPFL